MPTPGTTRSIETGRVLDGLLGACAPRLRRSLLTDTRAAPMIALVQQLYEIERAWPTGPPIAPGAADRRESVPILAAIRAERTRSPRPCCRNRLSARPSAISQISGTPCSDASRTAAWRIDNNRAENQLRGVALGRKSWLFAGSFEGARRRRFLDRSSRVQPIDVSPFDYFKDVLSARRDPSSAADRRAHAPRLGRHRRPARCRLTLRCARAWPRSRLSRRRLTALVEEAIIVRRGTGNPNNASAC